MQTIIIRTQRDWNFLPSEFSKYTEIHIVNDSLNWITIKECPKNSTVKTYSKSLVKIIN